MTMPASPLLLLPAEIRNRIYGFCTPIDAYAEEFKGLLLTSRQLRREYESEALNVMRQFLASIEHQWPPSEAILFSNLSSFNDIKRVTVQLPLSLYFSKSRSEIWSKSDTFHTTAMESCLGTLYTLYLTRLTVTFYDDLATFINWSPWVIPTGLLLDLLNPLISPASCLGTGFSPERALRTSQFYQRTTKQQVRIRELAYNWSKSKVAHMSNLNALVQADVETTNFFLHESCWFQHPKGLVHNWGHGGDSMWFDLRAPSKGRA
ncbi:hypothetical protein P171DRAFT_14209 [Karstenula rhodostoma CBS 690.94]|uniref:F-box domain-containing protein n=1 Tax=Karstenula rhodostoma CBS 690.94 TaxID=1392251 RepID=A0A9P4PZR0_9PLEO|nr:hypothetical protein P171DRAFT_14209 [Karstenula rhodostoma CBS 690.94]